MNLNLMANYWSRLSWVDSVSTTEVQSHGFDHCRGNFVKLLHSGHSTGYCFGSEFLCVTCSHIKSNPVIYWTRWVDLVCITMITITMTMKIFYLNCFFFISKIFLFDHNHIWIETTIYKQFRKPNYKLVWRLLLRQINLSLS